MCEVVHGVVVCVGVGGVGIVFACRRDMVRAGRARVLVLCLLGFGLCLGGVGRGFVLLVVTVFSLVRVCGLRAGGVGLVLAPSCD